MSYNGHVNDIRRWLPAPWTEITAYADGVMRWHLENGLLLNPTKTEALTTGKKLAELSEAKGVEVNLINFISFSNRY